jgi:hypothetical protein
MAPNEIEKEQEKAINQRPNYFAGQYLLEDDFQLEQKYHIDRQRRHNRLLHVSGIAEGLNVSTGEDKKVKVSAGTAIDSQGRQIILLDKQDVDLVKDTNKNKAIQDGDYTFTIKYREELTEQQGQDGQKEQTNRRVQETPEFELILSTTLDVIPLAKLTIKGGKVEKIDLSVRQYSGICLPTEEGKGVTLRADGEKNPKLAVLDGSLSISGKLAVTEDTELKKTLTVKGNTTFEQELTVKNLFLGESGNGVRLRSHGDENPNLADLAGSLSISGTLAVTGESTLKGNVSANSGVTVTGRTELNNTLTVQENTSLQKDLNVKGTVTAKAFEGEGAVRKGMVVMWTGDAEKVPGGWALCDGTNGTPDLVSRFIVGAGKDAETGYEQGSNGEADTHTHTIQVPSQKYDTSKNGKHTHKYGNWYGNMAERGGAVTVVDRNQGGVNKTDEDGEHLHSITIEKKTIGSDPSTGKNRPKWYAICFIMKL